MSAREAAWRVRSTVRDAIDRPLVGLRRRRPGTVSRGAAPGRYGFAVTDVTPGAWAQPNALPIEREWLARLRQRADRIAAGHLRLFDQEDVDCRGGIDWNREYKAGIAAPLRFSPWLDYRDTRLVGDCKFVWEPNRHQHFVVLGRAYRASGDVRYARAILQQWTSWLEQCPYGMGMNWRSPLELGIRLINWVWAFELVRPSGMLQGTVLERLLHSVHLHLVEITRKYSQGSSANNHVIGEAAGVFVAASYFRSLAQADRWRSRGYDILCEQIGQQTFDDGGNREQAIGYHLFVLQFFVLAGLVGRWTDCAFPASYWLALERQFAFVAALREGGDTLPMIGDADDGYVLDLGADGADLEGWLTVGTVLFGRPDLRTAAGGLGEAGRWLLGRDGPERFEAVPPIAPGVPLSCRALRESGLYLLQSGHYGGDDRISVTFDCGPLGMGSIAAHGHADALSVTLRAFGVDVLVDPGTYDYFTYPAWREYFRSTRGHNTVVIDGQDQSVMRGLFLWGQRASARCVAWEPGPDGGLVCGEHDGYTRLDDPVVHRRTVELDGARRQVEIVDEIVATGQHRIEVRFHLAEQCHIKQLGPNLFEIDTERGLVRLEVDARLEVRMDCGNRQPIAGWVSRGYHRKVPSVTLTGQCEHLGEVRLHSRLTMGIQ
jgi:hypothetical protein